MDRTYVMICQHLYCPGILKAVRKEANNCDTCQRTKRSKIEYGTLPANKYEQMPCNKICVDLKVPYAIRKRDRKKN